MRLDELRWTEIESKAGLVFVVPLGSIEQHGPHLPLATDTRIISEIARRVETRLAAEAVFTPAVWLGHSPHHERFGCLSLDVRPYMEMIAGICRSLARLGARKILLLNGHGGNDVPCKAAMRELKAEFRSSAEEMTSAEMAGAEMQIVYATYWSLAAEAMKKIRESPRGGMGHACEMETSIMLAVAPEQVSMPDAVDDGTFRNSGYHLLDMLHPQPYFMVREFDEISSSGTLGMPSLASAEKGERFLAAAVESVAAFIRDFAGWDFAGQRASEAQPER